MGCQLPQKLSTAHALGSLPSKTAVERPVQLQRLLHRRPSRTLPALGSSRDLHPHAARPCRNSAKLRRKTTMQTPALLPQQWYQPWRRSWPSSMLCRRRRAGRLARSARRWRPGWPSWRARNPRLRRHWLRRRLPTRNAWGRWWRRRRQQTQRPRPRPLHPPPRRTHGGRRWPGSSGRPRQKRPSAQLAWSMRASWRPCKGSWTTYGRARASCTPRWSTGSRRRTRTCTPTAWSTRGASRT
mmetsp:Transcript_2493/g.4225  ORF Transcript_2493/g.4225 Transcript_2493/m.4225 type:complete len:241 (+) Transcript_2493:170-892(+)